MAGAGGVRGWKIEVTNLKQIINAIEDIDKTAVKRIEKTIKTVANRIAVDAGYETSYKQPLSNWGSWISSRDGRDLSFETSDVVKGFKVKKNNYMRKGVSAGFGFDVVQTNAAGAIFEVMGSGDRVTNDSGKNLVDVVNNRFPRKQPRSLIPAYYQNMNDEVRESIRDHIISEARKAGLR
jgi:hypothetical protein